MWKDCYYCDPLITVICDRLSRLIGYNLPNLDCYLKLIVSLYPNFGIGLLVPFFSLLGAVVAVWNNLSL